MGRRKRTDNGVEVRRREQFAVFRSYDEHRAAYAAAHFSHLVVRLIASGRDEHGRIGQPLPVEAPIPLDETAAVYNERVALGTGEETLRQRDEFVRALESVSRC